MKKVFLFSLFLLIPSISFATSGACSSHRGVNCSAGASYTGKVQCNDGWENSSVYFSEADECKPLLCNVESAQFANGRNGRVGSGVGEALVNNCVESNTYISNSYSNSYNNLPTITDGDALNNAMQRFCIEKYGINSFSDMSNKRCDCNSGYIKNSYNNFRCEPEKEVLENTCKKQFGEKSIVSLTDKNKCACSEGFVFGQDNKCTNISETPLGKFNTAFDKIYYQSFVDYPDLPKNIDKEIIKKIAMSPEYRNTPIWDVIRKYANDNNLITQTSKQVVATTSDIKSETGKFFSKISFTRTLKKGMSGNDVKQLQVLLQKLDYLPSTHVPSNSFGPVTNNALIKFQKDNKITPATGSFGPTTQAKLISLVK